MSILSVSVTILACLLAVSSSPLNENQVRATCTVNSYDNLNDAVSSCTDITIGAITVPAGNTLNLSLKDGANVTFNGYVKFDYKEWDGPLMIIKGKAINVQGTADHSFDGQGSKYWDGYGSSGGKTKPIFVRIQATGGSIIKNINLDNCPRHCVAVGNSEDLTLSNWNIDSSDGDSLGRNTDGFDISSSTDVVIENSVIKNQDDCVVVNQGSNMKFVGLTCSGGHGLSLSVGMSKTDPSANVVSNIVFSDCTVLNSRNGIHVKTHADATTGSIKTVTYSNIKLSGITYYGVNVQEDYANGGSTGTAKGNIPITGLTLANVDGTMTGSNSVPVYILCGDGGCQDWLWSGVSITGNEKSNYCNFTPSGFTC